MGEKQSMTHGLQINQVLGFLLGRGKTAEVRYTFLLVCSFKRNT